MKKSLMLLLALILAFTACTAFAATIAPSMSVDISAIDNCELHVAFKLADVTDTAIHADICDVLLYDAGEIDQLQIGDVISYRGKDVAVKSIAVDNCVEINGGIHEDGITLFPNEGGAYIAYSENTPVYVSVGSADLPLADQIAFRHWQQDDLGGIMDEYARSVVPAAQLKDLLANEGDPLYPDSTVVTIENGKIIQVTIIYTP